VPVDFEKLRLAPGFLLNLNVLEDSDFTGSFRIDEAGDVSIPVVGTLHVAGDTVNEARLKIRKALLDQQILKNPQVELALAEYIPSEVTIMGEINSPGKYPLLAPHKLVDVLAVAGGPTGLAGDQVLISNADSGAKPLTVHYSKMSDPKDVEGVIVRPGDTVQVMRAGIVYVLGSVNRPGGYIMQEEGSLDLLQAISLANGTSSTASTGTVFVLRRNQDGTAVQISMPYKKIVRGRSANVQLHAADIVYVPSSTFKEVLTNSQGILASAASASIYAVAVY
jgi:polysaccharide export outer membrane protein